MDSPNISEDVSPLLSIPFVVRTKILGHLELHEHLKLRQTCKTTKEWIDTSSIVQSHIPVTFIKDNGRKTFAKFLEKRPPHLITSLFVDNESCDFLHDPTLPYFLHLYSSNITSLRVNQFFTCLTKEEMKFYESFQNLEELGLNKISISSANEVAKEFPKNFKNLKVLKLGSVKAFPEPPDDLFGATLIPLGLQRPMGLYTWNLITFCEKLEYLTYPKTSKYFFQAFIDGRGRGEFGVFCDYIRNRQLHNPKEPNLQFCDFKNDSWYPDSKNALSLLKLGYEYKIKYLNVNCNQFQYIKIDPLIKMYDLPSNASECILSFKNFNCLISECLPKVERISMTASEVNTMLDYSCVFNGPKSFPELREIEIVIDVGFSYPDPDKYTRAREFRDVQILLSHFFYDMEMICDLGDNDNSFDHVRIYDKVERLTISFEDLSQKTLTKATPKDLPLKWIVKGLPNLKKLELIGWDTKEEETYQALWKRFTELEEIVLKDCENISQSCFQGLKSLKRLTIKDKLCIDDIMKMISEELNLHPSHFLNQSSQQGYTTLMGAAPSHC